jgi:AbrB family looped-hinge helix DNA binding protein
MRSCLTQVEQNDSIIKSVIMKEPVKSVLRAKAKLNANGRIVIPAVVREAMGVKPGDTLLLDLEDGVLRVESLMMRVRRIQEEVAKYIPPGVLLSEELIAERREEARREEEEIQCDLEAARIRKAG